MSEVKNLKQQYLKLFYLCVECQEPIHSQKSGLILHGSISAIGDFPDQSNFVGGDAFHNQELLDWLEYLQRPADLKGDTLLEELLELVQVYPFHTDCLLARLEKLG